MGDMSHLQSPKSQPRNGVLAFLPVLSRRIPTNCKGRPCAFYPTVQFDTSSHGNPTLHTHVNLSKAKIPLHGADTDGDSRQHRQESTDAKRGLIDD